MKNNTLPKRKKSTKGQKWSKNITQKTTDRATWMPLKTGGERMWSAMVSSSASRVAPIVVQTGDNSWIVLCTSDHYDGLFVSVIVSSVVELWFDTRSVQTKDYKHGIYCFSAKYATLRSKSKTGWVGIRVMEQCGGTCLPADCCINELAQ